MPEHRDGNQAKEDVVENVESAKGVAEIDHGRRGEAFALDAGIKVVLIPSVRDGSTLAQDEDPDGKVKGHHGECRHPEDPAIDRLGHEFEKEDED